MIASQWAGDRTVSGQGWEPGFALCDEVLVALFPKDCPDEEMVGVEGVEEVPEAPSALHDISTSASVKTTRIEMETDFECCNTTAFLFDQGAEQWNHSKENNENDSKIENQFLYTTTRLKHGSRAAATKNTTQTSTTCLQQDKHDNRYTKNNLYDPDCRKP